MEMPVEVKEARVLFKEAMDEWSVMKWLSEKKRVRKAADACNATLDRMEKEITEGWDAELKAAYAKVSGGGNSEKVSADVERLAKTIKEAHDAAIAARNDAEETFATAEKRMSVSGARDGAKKALAGWDLHEAAINKAESALARK